MSRRANLKLVAVDGDLVAGTEVPAVSPVEYRAANDAMPAAPGWGPEGEDAPAAAKTAAAPRRWTSLPAIALSLAAHAALLAGVAAFLTRAGSEAETDAVAVEIVFERQPSLPAEPAPTKNAEAAADEAPEIADVPVEADEFVPPTDATTEALLAEPPVVEAAVPETVEPVAEEPTQPAPAEVAEIAPPANAATEALLAEPPVIEPAVPEAAETTAEVPAEPVPVEAAEIAPPTNAATEALLAEPPVIEAGAREAVEPETIELPAPDPALTVLSVPPTIEVTPEAVANPIAASTEAADTTQLPDAVSMTPSPRPQAEPPAAKSNPAPPAQANDQAPRKTAEAPKAKAKKSEAPKKTERVAEAKPAPATKKVAGEPSAKRSAKSESAAGAAASAGASAGVEAAYGRKLLGHVERRKRYPAAARAAKVTGAVRLSITIDRNGQLRSVRVAKGSGHAVLDEEALATARRASPYPAPPDGVGGKTFAFAVTLRFSR